MGDLKIVVHPDVYRRWEEGGLDMTDVLAYEHYVQPSTILGGGYHWAMSNGRLTLAKNVE